MIAPDLEFQGLIYDILKADADVMAIATDIYDDVLDAAIYPYVTIGSDKFAFGSALCSICLGFFSGAVD